MDRSRMAFGLAAACLCAAAAQANLDDHGSAPEEATLLVADGAASNGTIETDTDQDWFRFVALPGIAYAVNVTASSIWDVVLDVRGPHEHALLASADSATSAAPPRAAVAWTNSGAAGTYYIGVSGYLLFTTGTYSIAVQALNVDDTDHDGLPDAWETAHLHTLAWGADDDPDGDGAGNLEEYFALTEPSLGTSALRITAISQAPGSVSLQWPGAPRSSYRVRRADSPGAALWTVVETNYNLSDQPRMLQWSGMSGETARVYRVDLMISN